MVNILLINSFILISIVRNFEEGILMAQGDENIVYFKTIGQGNLQCDNISNANDLIRDVIKK